MRVIFLVITLNMDYQKLEKSNLHNQLKEIFKKQINLLTKDQMLKN